MRFEVLSRDGTIVVATLNDGVLLKIRAHGADISASEALSLAGLLTRVAIEAHLAMIERNLGHVSRLMAEQPPRCPGTRSTDAGVERCRLGAAHPADCEFSTDS